MDVVTDITLRLAKTTWVVVLKVDGKYTLLLEPGLGKPWCGQNVFGQKMASAIAVEARREGVEAKEMTWGDAWSLLSKEYGGLKNLEKDLMDRVLQKQLSDSNAPAKKKPLEE